MLRAIAVLSAVIAFSLVSTGAARQTSDATSKPPSPKAKKQKQPEQCSDAEKAIVYYRSQTWKYQALLGESKSKTNHPEKRKNACGYKRWSAHKWQAKANKTQAHYEYHYAWWEWLPAKWARIGGCETGYGKPPGQWTWNSGRYQGAFGFYYGTWDAYKPAGAPSEAYLATPRQQYQAALNVYADHGYGAWGCGGA